MPTAATAPFVRGNGCTCTGEPLTTLFTSSSRQLALLQDYCKREATHFTLLTQILLGAGTAPLMLDVGANFGLYGLYAAALGADVVAVAPHGVPASTPGLEGVFLGHVFCLFQLWGLVW